MRERHRELLYFMLKDIWRLSEEEFARLRQVDPGKLALCAFLLKKIGPWVTWGDGKQTNRIQEILRRPIPARGNQSYLDMILGDRIDEVIESEFRLVFW